MHQYRESHDSAPPLGARLPEPVKKILPPNPEREENLREGIESALRDAPAPAAPVVPAVAAAPRVVAPPPLSRFKSLVWKPEKASPVHRARMIVGALSDPGMFGADYDHNADFARWLGEAEAVYANGMGGKRLAESRFLENPWSVKLAEALGEMDGKLSWSTLLAIVRGVWYCDAQERKSYLVHLGRRITRGEDDTPFDTDALHEKVFATANATGASIAGDNGKACIWVVDDLEAEQPAFYTHVCIYGRFHHSSFLSGEHIGAAGEWRITDGVVQWISGCSGHYHPRADQFERALRYLRQHLAIADDSQVLLWSGHDRAGSISCNLYLDQPDQLRGRLPFNL